MVNVAFLSIICISIIGNVISNIPPKVSLDNECTYNDLKSGTYIVTVKESGYTFYVDCLVDGTMYINPGQQDLYHYHKPSAENDLEFSMLIDAEYSSKSDIINEHDIDLDDSSQRKDGELPPVPPNEEEPADDDASVDIELTDDEKKSVNATAQYIVYAVIIIMALIFSLGICLLLYWWCCHNKSKSNNNDHHKINANASHISSLSASSLNSHYNLTETQPFIDIRSESTIQKQKTKRFGKTVHIPSVSTSNSNKLLLDHDQQSNIYEDIDDNDDEKEDGDELISDYGSTTNTNTKQTGYIIKKI